MCAFTCTFTPNPALVQQLAGDTECNRSRPSFAVRSSGSVYRASLVQVFKLLEH